MEFLFYIFGVIAIFTTLMVLISNNPIHALLYLVVSLLSLSGVFFSLGAYFAGVLECILYINAIIVLFVFVIMMLNLNSVLKKQKRIWFATKKIIVSVVLSISLLSTLIYGISDFSYKEKISCIVIGIKDVGIILFGKYIFIVEFISLLLLTSLVVTFYIGNKRDINS